MSQFSPREIDRMPLEHAHWVMVHLPFWERRAAELALVGDEDGAWALRRALASVVGRIRQGSTPDDEWNRVRAARLKEWLCRA